MKGRIFIYSITGCPHCMRAKNTLQQLNLEYHDINLDTFPGERDGLFKRCGRKTVPQIFFNSIHVGGNNDLQKLSEAEMAKLIDEVKNNEIGPDSPKLPDPKSADPKSGAYSEDFVCEPDEYSSLVKEVRKSGLIKDHRTGLSVQKKTFNGKEFVDWVVKTKGLERAQAVEMGQVLIDRHFGHDVKKDESFKDDASVYYRLLDDDDLNALNAGEMSPCEPRAANDLGEDVRRLILKLYSAFLSPDGKKVNYQGIGKSDEFKTYVMLTKELQRVRLDDASREEKLAFFINIYNALVIHGFIAKGAPTNLWQRYKFFNTTRYIIAGLNYSLQDIENGVLRANRKGVGQFSSPFGKNDPRLKIALDTPEPRIHFALVCGAKSCPPIKTYSSKKISDQLALATEGFLEGEGFELDTSRSPTRVRLSQILKWYRVDFGHTDREVLKWVHDHMGDCEKKVALALSLLAKEAIFKIEYLPYDWGTNSH